MGEVEVVYVKGRNSERYESNWGCTRRGDRSAVEYGDVSRTVLEVRLVQMG